MTERDIDVLGIGNAIVDVLAESDDDFLTTHNLVKGSMTIINHTEAENIYNLIKPGIRASGGSAANTLASLASLDIRCGFIGKVSDDELGNFFTEDIKSAGVVFNPEFNSKSAPTARCLISVTPDAERTMQTFLGACVDLSPNDINEKFISRAKILYLEGYLFDPPEAQNAFEKAAKISKQNDGRVALSLSDSFCVGRHREAFLDFIREYVSILFANEDEIKSLYQADEFESAAKQALIDCEIAVLTRGSKGSVVIAEGQYHELKPETVKNVIDTTGAGDAYAAGFLFGLIRGKPLDVCGYLGGIIAGEIISNYGARSKKDLNGIVQES